jgi:hypothetical protein
MLWQRRRPAGTDPKSNSLTNLPPGARNAGKMAAPQNPFWLQKISLRHDRRKICTCGASGKVLFSLQSESAAVRFLEA